MKRHDTGQNGTAGANLFAVRYGVMLFVVAAAIVVRILLQPLVGDKLPFVTLILAVVFTARYCGRGPAVASLLLGSLGVAYFILLPRFSFAVQQFEYKVGLILYGFVAVAAIAMFESLRKAGARLEQELEIRRSTERVLAEQKERLRTTLASIGDAVITTDREGRVTNLNAVAEALTGWTNEAAAGLPLTQVFHIVNETTRQPVENPALRALKQGVVVGLANHTILIAKDGTERPIDDSAAPIRCKVGEMVGCVLVFRDISERKQLERERQAAQDRVLRTLESVPDGFFALDRDWKFTYVNRAAEQLVGRTADELIGKDFWQSFPGVLGSRFEPIHRKTMAEGIAHALVDYYPDHARWYEVNSYPAPDGITIFFRDVTEKMQVEEALRKNTALLRAVSDGTPDLIFIKDRDSRMIFANPATLKVIGKPAHEVLGRTDLEWHNHRDEAEAFAANDRRIMATGITEVVEEMHTGADGTHVYLSTKSPMRDEAGNVVGVISLTRDVSEQKRIEASERTARERLRMALSAARMVAWEFDPATGTVASDNSTEVFGLVGGLTDVAQGLAMLHPDDVERHRTTLYGAVERGEGFTSEFRIIRPDTQAIRWMEERGHALRNEKDGSVRLVGVVMDISERKQAEEHFRTLAENIPQLAWMARPDGYIFWYNRRWYEYTGTTPDAQEGWGWESVHDPAVLPKVMERWKESLSEGKPFDMVFPLKGKDGVFRPFITRVMPVHDSSGRVVQWFGTNTDVSEQQALEEALRQGERRLRFVMDSMPQKIFTAQPEGDVDYFNPIWMQFTGLSFDDIQGWGWKQFIHPDDLAETLRVWRQSLDGGSAYQFEHRFRQHDGVYRWHLSRALPMHDESGRIVSWIGSNTDIHEQKRTAEDLRKLTAQLSENDRRKDEFLATLAHELRNPLAPIRTGLQIMKLSGGTGTNSEQARTMMERQMTQLVRLVDDLMDVSRITRGKLELRRQRMLLTTVLNSAVETSRPLIEEMGHTLGVDVPSQPIHVNADLTRLAQVFLNLLNNAAKYSDLNGRIELKAERIGNEVVVSVKDSGIGIAADQLPHIFEMFSQVARSIDRAQGGLGIGLTLVKRLVEMHHGRIEAKSEGAGKGSEFIVYLPIVTESAKPKNTEGEGEVGAKSTLRILIVDDNRDSADSLAMMLQILGNETRTAYDGVEAVKQAEDFQPHAVLLDIGLPKLNGYEVCRAIRERFQGKAVVIIAQTGWGQEEDRRRTTEAGFDHHMVKPVDTNVLMKLLAGLSPTAGK